MKKHDASFPSFLLKNGKIKEQFHQVVKDLILSGQLKSGTKLPSSRALSEMMSISRNSVISGFERLIDEGYLISRRVAGTFVSGIIPDEVVQVANPKACDPPPGTMDETPVSQRVDQLQALWEKSAPDRGVNQTFNIGVGCTDLFPHPLWGRLLGRVWRQFDKQIWKLNGPMGFEPLRVAIADYVCTTRGVNCSAEQIMIVNGTQQAMNIAGQVLIQEGDEIWLDEPGYDGARGVFTSLGAQIRAVPGDGCGMDIGYGIEHWPDAKLVFTAPSHQFPLGGTLSLARRMALLDWAVEHKKWIFEDDYNSEFRYAAQPIQALQGLCAQQRVIYAGSFSKMMFSEFRLGFLVIPPSLLEPFKVAKYYADTRLSYLEQATLALFISEGHYARHVRRIRKACYERQQAVIEAIQRYLPDCLRVQPADSGIHLVCWLADNLHESDVIAKCRAAGLGAQPLSRYRQNMQPGQAILLGFAAHTPDELRAGVQKLAGVIA